MGAQPTVSSAVPAPEPHGPAGGQVGPSSGTERGSDMATGRAGPAPGLRGQHVLILAACLMPFLAFVLASRGTWLLDYRWEDNWSYLKYFDDWASPDPILRDFMDRDYKGARVAWIIPGFLVYHALEPLSANLVLNGAVAIASILLTFWLAARLFGRAAAGAATIVASAFPIFYASGVSHAWSYQGSICNVYYLLLLLGLTGHATAGAGSSHASAWPRRRWAFLAGAAGALLMLTGTTYIVALPWALAYWMLLRVHPVRAIISEIVEAAAFGILGVILVVCVLSAATVLAGGQALFMLPLLQRSVGIASGGSFGEAVQVWLPGASWLAFPAIVLLGGSATAARLVWQHAPLARPLLFTRPARPFVAAFVGFAGLWLTMIGLEASIQAYVQYEHYNYTIIGPAALALAGVFRWLPRGSVTAPGANTATVPEPRWPAWVLPALAALVILPQMMIGPEIVSNVATPVTQALRALSLPGTAVVSVLVAGVGLAILAIGLGVGGVGRTWRAFLPAVACFGAAAALTNPSAAPFHLNPVCSVERENLLLVTDVSRWLSSKGWHVNTRTWYSPADAVTLPDGCGPLNLIWTFASIEQASMAWKVSMPIPPRLADLSVYEVRNIGEKRRSNIVILSEPGRAAQYNSELTTWARTSGVNPSPRLSETRTFTRGPLSLTVQVYRLRGG